MNIKGLMMPIGLVATIIFTLVPCVWVLSRQLNTLETQLGEMKNQLVLYQQTAKADQALRALQVDTRLSQIETWKRATENDRFRKDDMQIWIERTKAANPTLKLPDVKD